MKVTFFPYHDDMKKYGNRNILQQSDFVIDYFPMLNKKFMDKIKQHDVKVLAYVSIYKVPRINQIKFRTGFYGGSPAKEEVIINPFWSNVAVGDNHRIVINEKGEEVKPFKKGDYKYGWYQSCLSSGKKKILEGIELLLDEVDGLFIDNIITPDDCYQCPDSSQKMQEEIVNEINEVSDMLFINVGRKQLYEGKFNADVYVIENFCHGEKTDPDRLYLSSRYYTDETSFIEEMDLIKSNIDAKILGYTKVPKGKENLLVRSKELADKCGIEWTTTLKNLGAHPQSNQ